VKEGERSRQTDDCCVRAGEQRPGSGSKYGSEVQRVSYDGVHARIDEFPGFGRRWFYSERVSELACGGRRDSHRCHEQSRADNAKRPAKPNEWSGGRSTHLDDTGHDREDRHQELTNDPCAISQRRIVHDSNSLSVSIVCTTPTGMKVIVFMSGAS
jgi:hypothetical protein